MAHGPLAELDAALPDQGLHLDRLHAASAVLGLARLQGWDRSHGRGPVAWLAQVACEVLLVPRFGPMPAGRPIPETPALDKLQERLQANGIDTEPRQFASVVLGLALANGWSDHPERMLDWLEQLAIDVASGGRDPYRK